MQISLRLRRLVAALLLVPLCAGFQPLAAAQRTETASVLSVVALAAPPGVLSDPPGGWLRSVPVANGNPLYMIWAVASSTAVTDTISAAEWTESAVVPEVLAPGAAVPVKATVYLYRRGVTAPAAPTGTFTFTFDPSGATAGTLSGGSLNGWTQAIPDADGNPLWVIVASAWGSSGTDSIAATEFSAAVQLAQDSNDGLNLAVVRLYQRAASAPTAPGIDLTYTFPAGLTNVPKSVRSNLLLANDGNTYFAASAGGAGYGAVGRLTPDGVMSTVYAFANGAEGLSSFGGLMQASDGNLYGTTYFGGDDSYGTVFKLTLAGEFTKLHQFTKANSSPKYPYTGLVQASDGNLYGTTRIGGDHNKGAIFRLATDGSGYAVIHSFSGTDGQEPQGQLIVGPDGLLYGTSMLGGDKNRGVIYRIALTGEYTRLYSFPVLNAFNDVGLATNATGANPRAGLLLSGGKYYGTTYQGGAHGNGTVFSATVTGDSADVEVLHHFEGAPFDGGFPLATPVLGPDGSLYGTTERGGYADVGTAWKVAPDGSGSEMLHAFFGDLSDGSQPYAGLLFANGALYGVSNSDDTGAAGSIFKLEQDSGSGLPVNITVSAQQLVIGQYVQIDWSAPNAVACNKFGSWAESTDVNDPEHVTLTAGSKTTDPGIGIVTYALACTDAANVTHNSFVGVFVDAPPQETVDGGKIIGGGAISWLMLALLAALLFVKLIKETRSSCP